MRGPGVYQTQANSCRTSPSLTKVPARPHRARSSPNNNGCPQGPLHSLWRPVLLVSLQIEVGVNCTCLCLLFADSALSVVSNWTLVLGLNDPGHMALTSWSRAGILVLPNSLFLLSYHNLLELVEWSLRTFIVPEQPSQVCGGVRAMVPKATPDHAEGFSLVCFPDDREAWPGLSC